MIDKNIIKDFKILNSSENKVSYLDSAATTQKPTQVIEAMARYYENSNANPHRGAYALSVEATRLYHESKEKVAFFIGAKSSDEIIYVKNATEGFNFISNTYGMKNITEGDEIVISIAEHHSNLIPWQKLAKKKGAILKYMYVNEEGKISEEEYKSKITEKTKIVSITHVSNALGAIFPVKEIAKYAHEKGAIIIIDGSQSVPHMKIDVSDLDADFFVFSAHKMLGPMGIGVVYGKKALLEKMEPFFYGGDMIEYVYEQDATFAEVPTRFEAGTQNVEGAVGLSAAIDYLEKIGMENVHEHEKELTEYAMKKLAELEYVKVYGPKDLREHAGVISFRVDSVHPHDVATIFDNCGVAIRAGNHCAQPLMRYMGIDSTCRASFYVYNTKEDVDKLIDAIKKTYEMFSKWR